MHIKMVALGMKRHVSLQLNVGHLDCLRYAHDNVALGMKIRVNMQLLMDNWIVCITHMRMVCPCDENTCRLAAQYGYLDFCITHMRMVVIGMKRHVDLQLNMDIWIVYAMHMRMVVIGMKLRVDLQLIWTFGLFTLCTRVCCPWDETTCRLAAQYGTVGMFTLCT